jgi:ribosomal protein S11
VSDQKLVINAKTGEQTLVALTSDEIAEREARHARHEAMMVERELREAARQSAISKLAALGLTVDEISAAFGLDS